MVRVVPIEVVAIAFRVFREKFAILIIVHDYLEPFPPVFHFLFSGHLIKAEIIACLRMFLHKVYHFLNVVCQFLTKQEELKFFLIERKLVPFFD